MKIQYFKNRSSAAHFLSFGAALLLSTSLINVAKSDEFVVSFKSLESALNPERFVPAANSFTQSIPSTVLTGKKRRKYFTDTKLGSWRKAVSWNNTRVANSGRGTNVTVAVMDGTADCTHSAFSPGQCSRFVDTNGTYNYYSDHGTLVSSLIGGQGSYGVASNSRILSYGIFDDNGYRGDAWLNVAMTHAANNGASIANWSFGPRYSYNIFQSDSLLQTVNTFRDNILVVKTAGNGNSSGVGGNITTRVTSNFSGNAFSDQLKNLIIVGALNRRGTRLAGYSNRPGNGCLLGWGETACTKANQYKYYFIVAPGQVRGAASGNRTQVNTGTSFAAPIVSGAAALIKSKWQHLNPTEVRQILLITAKDKGKKGVDPVYGRGVLNINRALDPINGTVSLSNGETVTTGRAVPFTALASTSNLSKSGVKIIDRFRRDFEAVNETAIPRINEQVIPAGNGLSKSYISVADLDGDGYTFDGFGYEDMLSLDLNIAEPGIFGFLDGGVQHSQVGYLPDMLAQLSIGSTHVAYRLGERSLFAVMADEDTVSPTRPNMFGMTQVKNHFLDEGTGLIKDASTGLTLALIEETGRFGINSIPEFGFDDTTTGLFGEVSHSVQFDKARLTGAVSSTYYPEGVNSATLNSSGLGFASASLKMSYAFDPQGLMRLELGGTTGNLPFGDLQSNVLGLNSLNDIYATSPKVTAGLSYQFRTDSHLKMVVEQAMTETRGAMSFKLAF